MPRVALIGCGRWGRNIARNLHNLNALAAVCDQSENRAAAFADEFQTSARSWPDLLNDPAIDAVALTTPIQQHAAQAIAALQAGKHVFVEKPLATSLGQLAAINDAANESGCTVMAGHLLRYHPAFTKMQALIHEGVIGKLQHIVSERLHYSPGKPEEDVLWDFGPHDAAMLLALTDAEPTHLFAHGQILQAGRHTHDLFTLHGIFPGGVSATIRLNRLAPRKQHCLTVWGSHGALVFDDTQGWESKLTHYVDGHVAMTYPLDAAEPLRLECEHFLACIQSGDTPLTDLVESQRIIQLLEAALAQALPSPLAGEGGS